MRDAFGVIQPVDAEDELALALAQHRGELPSAFCNFGAAGLFGEGMVVDDGV